MRAHGVSLVAGSLLALVCNVALPHDQDDFAFVQLVARSDAWPWLHAGLFVAVLLVVTGLLGVAAVALAAGTPLRSIANGALLIGSSLMLTGLVTAGVALRKAADNTVMVLETQGSGPDLSGSFFSALGFDRLSYALYGGAAIVLLGVVPMAIGVGMYQFLGQRLLGAFGVLAGALSAVTGFVQLVAETSTRNLFLVASIATTAWVMVTGALLVRGTVEEMRPLTAVDQ